MSRMIFGALAAMLVWAVSSVSSAADVIWLEAELFKQLGGWTNDAQFVDQMGSPYLLAIGLEGPVADAVTTAAIPRAGEYRLWVRNRDWTPEHSPGQFQVILGETTVAHVFGKSRAKGWVWEDGGAHTLPAGPIEVRLHDLTGHYSRCDALVLSADPNFQPPGDIATLGKLRIAHGGVSRDVKELGPYDTVVVGGGLAGTFAAVASARHGCKTALVQNRPVLGGNGSEEILVRPEGDTTREPLDPGEGGIIEEVRGDVEGYSDRMRKLVESTPNLDLFLNTHATGVQKNGERAISGVEAIDVTTKQRCVFRGKQFIDCTGDGMIGVWAGNEWRHGREPRAMYNESRAPEEGDAFTMGNTLRYASALAAGPVAFQAPPWARKFDDCGDFNVDRHPQIHFGGWQWVIEYGGLLNTYHDSEEIRDELLRIIWGMWDHVKNHCDQHSEEARNYKLTWVSHVAGKRESRRLIGDHVMTEHDIAAQRLFDDRVSYAGWGIDIHPPGGFYDKEPPAIFSHKVKFSIPFRSLYAKDIDNLMMAGRDISVSHVALGATRVMITCGLQGQAVGTAAGLCRERNTGPRGVYQNYITDLQQRLLKDGCYLIDLPNQDPHDLARLAQVSASSQSPPVEIRPDRLSVHPLNHERAVMFRVSAGRLEKIALMLQSENRQPTPITLTLRPAAALGDFSSTEDIAQAQATVPRRGRGWVSFDIGKELPPGYYYVSLPATPGISWELFGTTPPDTARAYRGGDAWNSMPETYQFKLSPGSEPVAEPAAPPREMFATANVTNGYARAVRGVPNSWRPDPKSSLPQWVELDLGDARTFDTVHVSFQTQALRADTFRLEVPDGAGWRTVSTVAGNLARRRVLQFPAVTAPKLRLVIEKAQPEMGVCEIRVYDEKE